MSTTFKVAERIADAFAGCHDPEARSIASEAVLRVADRYPQIEGPPLLRLVSTAVRNALRNWVKSQYHASTEHRDEMFWHAQPARRGYHELALEAIEAVREEDQGIAFALLVEGDTYDEVFGRIDGRNVDRARRIRNVKSQLREGVLCG